MPDGRAVSARVWSTLRHAVGAALPVIAAGALASAATRPNIPTWYAALAKPAFTPPAWVFAPAWTLLYLLMAWAFFRVLQVSRFTPWRGTAIVCFLLQIALNAAWSWVFFAGHDPAGGVILIAVLWLAIAATALAFWRVDGWAGALLLPYLAWVGFAGLLTLEIYRLN